MNRREFQAMAEIRLREAKLLLDNGMYDGAYYLCGYAIECALKACIAKRTRLHDFPPPPRAISRMYTHNLVELVGQSGLQSDFEAARDSDSSLNDNWGTVQEWTEESRYARHERIEAEAMYAAVADKRHGVFRWFRRRW